MRRGFWDMDAGDRRTIAGAATVAGACVTALVLRLDWCLIDGWLTFRRAGRNIAAYALGSDLLPYLTVFTLLAIAVTAAAGAIALGPLADAPPRRSRPWRRNPSTGRPACAT